MTLYFRGNPTHAAYPENGISPAAAVGQLLYALPALSDSAYYRGMTMCTVIGTHMVEKAFGAAAADTEVWLTLRAEHNGDLTTLHNAILDMAAHLAQEQHLAFSYEIQNVFPATENTPVLAEKALDLCHGQLLDVPMRWSEDFGHYLQICPGTYFGIGTGENHPALHTEDYEYPDALLEPTVEAFVKLMENI